MMFILAIASLLALAEGRRHLCDDGTRPICSDGSKAVYNRPTGKNTGGSTYFPYFILDALPVDIWTSHGHLLTQFALTMDSK